MAITERTITERLPERDYVDNSGGNHIDADGNVVPAYVGGVNGPRLGSGESFTESDGFDDDPTVYDGPVPGALEALERRAGQLALAAKAARAITRSTADGSREPRPPRISAAQADLGGGYTDAMNGTLPSSRANNGTPSAQKINPRTGRPTVGQQNANERAHRAQAWRQRWGK